MVGGADDETDPDAIAALGPGEGSEDDLVHLGAGTEQETAVERPAGHFDQGALIWDEADSSAHTPIRRKKWAPLTNHCRSVAYRDKRGVLEILGGSPANWVAPRSRSPLAGRRSIVYRDQI